MGFIAASEVILLGRETIFRNGERVGWLASGGYGHTVCKAIGYGYVRRAAGVDAEFVMSGGYTLEVAGEHVPGEPFPKPLCDPAGRRVRAWGSRSASQRLRTDDRSDVVTRPVSGRVNSK